MTRNIWLTFEEWFAIKEEVNPENWWCYELFPREIKEWKDDIKIGYRDSRCFKRAGVANRTLNKIKTPYLYNRLLQENYRNGDLNCMMFIRNDHCYFGKNSIPDSDEMNQNALNNFISWATACVDGIDMNTTKEQWIKYNKAMKIAVEDCNQNVIMLKQMVDLFRSVTVA